MSSPLPIIWFAFATSQLLFAGLGWWLHPGYDPDSTTTVMVLGAVALPLTLVATIGARLLMPAEEQHQARYFVRWAAAEAITLKGFVGAFLGGPTWFGLAAAAWGFFLILVAYPAAEPEVR
ncbi:MAG: hypothetical protein KTR31_12895 [Myxococcales bacterium]|nr:hypothetical protein [Myxococcales bacterium]